MTRKKRMPTTPELDPLAMRRRLRVNQTDFWAPVGVTQSGGSRYESGRALPPPVKRLLAIVYGTEKQSTKFVTGLRAYSQGSTK